MDQPTKEEILAKLRGIPATATEEKKRRGPRKRSDPLKSGTPEWDARQRCFRHNGLRGLVAMDKTHMRNIITSDSTSREAKDLAFTIYQQLESLAELLKTRMD